MDLRRPRDLSGRRRKSSRHSHLEDRMHRHLKVLATLSFVLLGSLSGNAQPVKAEEPNPVTAIDILLEPDATMVKQLASQVYPKKMLDEKFEAFTFSPVGASVYHLGNFGTARKKLKSWELKP
jgi:hypothetical protein